MEVFIHDVVLKKRIRKNPGNLTQLMESMRRHGLLNPIIIAENNELIAGHRRLEAAKRLGWHRIEAKICSNISNVDKLEIELDENIYRQDFSEEELAEGFTRLDKLKNPGFFRRIIRWIVRFFQRLFSRKRR